MGEYLSKREAIAEGYDKESYCYNCNETIWYKKDESIFPRCPRCGEVLQWKELKEDEVTE